MTRILAVAAVILAMCCPTLSSASGVSNPSDVAAFCQTSSNGQRAFTTIATHKLNSNICHRTAVTVAQSCLYYRCSASERCCPGTSCQCDGAECQCR